jgi:hypothetical protein
MYERFAEALVVGLFSYAALGFLFALAFVSRGVQRIDPEAKGTGVGFRLIIIPGVVAFWPLLLSRWLSGATEPPLEGNPHR